MPNTIITPAIVAKEACVVLDNNLVMANQVHRAHEDEFEKKVNGYKPGSTVSIRKPAQFVVRRGPVASSQDVTEGTTAITVNQQVGVDFKFSSSELTLNIGELSERVIKPALVQIVNAIDLDLMALYSNVWNWVGTPGNVINNFSKLGAAGQRLDEMAVPQDMRSAVLSPADQWALLGTQTGLYMQDAAKDAYRKAKLGMIGDFDTFKSQNVPTLTTGARGGAPVVNGAGQNVTYAGAVANTYTQTLNINGGTASVPGAAAAPAAAPTGFAGFGSGATRMSPEMREALNAAWKNPNTRSIAASMMSSMLQGKDAAWQLSTMGDQPVLFNARTAQIVPVGQAKRSTATVGNTVIDTNTGQPIYQGEQEPKTATVDGTIVDTRTGIPIYSTPAKPVTVSAGSTLVDPATGKPIFSAPTAEKDEAGKITAQVAAREAAGEKMGLTPGTPAAQSYALTGKIGRDQDLSATDKKAILDADEKVLAIEGTLTSLGRAKELSKDAYSGPLASMRGYAGSIVGLDRANKTQELDNTITSQALDSLKATFGAAPTEGERRILLEIQGSSSQSPEVRAAIYARAEAALQKRLAFERARAEDLRAGTFYKQDGAPAAKAAMPKGADRTAIPDGKSAGMALAEARAAVKANPQLKAQVADRLRSWGIDPARLD